MERPDEVKTLIILSPGFPANEQDSSCLPAQQAFVKALNKTNPHLRVIIVSLHYPTRTEAYSWFGNLVIPLDGGKYGKFLRVFLWIKTQRTLTRLLKSFPGTGILSLWYSETALLGHWMSKRFRRPHFCWILGQDARAINHYVTWTRIPAESLIALSDSIAEEFRRNHGISPGHLICNGIDPAKFPVYTKKDIDIMGAGSLIPLKRYHLLIETVDALKSSTPAIKAVICGSGKEERNLAHLVNKRGLDGNITFTGVLPHEEVLEYMNRAKILLHPSAYEGYSSSCLEALFAGCHVVSFTKPENAPIDHWHVVADKTEMVEQCGRLLTNETEFSRVLVRSMDDVATGMIRLFSPDVGG